MLKDMGLLTRADRTALAAYCVLCSRWVAAERQVQRLGPIVKSPEKNFPMKSPYLTIADQASIVFSEAANMVEASPQLTSRLKVVRSTRRIVMPRSRSFYKALSADVPA